LLLFIVVDAIIKCIIVCLTMNKPTRPATILSGMRSSLLIEILTGTHVGSRKLFT